MNTAEYNRRVRRWRDEAKARHGYTNAELAKVCYTSESAISHKKKLYRLPYYVVARIRELSEDG